MPHLDLHDIHRVGDGDVYAALIDKKPFMAVDLSSPYYDGNTLLAPVFIPNHLEYLISVLDNVLQLQSVNNSPDDFEKISNLYADLKRFHDYYKSLPPPTVSNS